MEETPIGKGYASPFLALLAHVDGEIARIDVTPLHGFCMPSYQSETEMEKEGKNRNTVLPLDAVISSTSATRKSFTATRGRIAPIPVPVMSEEFKENLVADCDTASMLNLRSQHAIQDERFTFQQTTGIAVNLAANAPLNPITRKLPSTSNGGETGDVDKTSHSIEIKDTIKGAIIAKSTDMGEVDVGEVLRAFWTEDEVFHRRLTVSNERFLLDSCELY